MSTPDNRTPSSSAAAQPSIDGAKSTPRPIPAPQLGLDAALALIAAARLEASARNVRLAYTVVDPGGNVIASARDDSSQLGALSLSGDKAYTAVAFRMPTSAWAATSTPGAGDWGIAGTLGGRAIVFAGGVPVFHDGQLVGGLGVSGAPSHVDEACAVAALESTGWSSVA